MFLGRGKRKEIGAIRGHKVMLGPDLAELYGVETRALMQGVKRYREHFPEDFMFALTRSEILRISQIVISLKYSKSVYAFTEQGTYVARSSTSRKILKRSFLFCVPNETLGTRYRTNLQMGSTIK
jgi:ORF6N domain